MAVDQREALIAAVRAQVEKEKAEKAAKLKREQEAIKLSGAKVESVRKDNDKPKYKTLSADELAKIEEKKKRKKAAELGIDLEELNKQIAEEVEAVVNKETKAPEAEKPEAEKSEENKAQQTESKSGLKLKSDTATGAKPVNDNKTKVIANDNKWEADATQKATVKEPLKNAEADDIINIVPNRTTPTNDVKSMYDIDDDDDLLGAEISKLATFDDRSAKKTQEQPAEEPEKKKNVEDKAEDEIKKQEEKQRKAEEARKVEEAKKAEEARKAEEAKKAEEARKAEETLKQEAEKKKKLEESERKLEEQARRIAEAEAKRKAEENARKRAEEAELKKIAEEAKRKALEEEKKKAAEEAHKKAEQEYRENLKKVAAEKAEAAKKKVEDITSKLESVKNDKEQAAKVVNDVKAQLDVEIKKFDEEVVALDKEFAEVSKSVEEENNKSVEAAKVKFASENSKLEDDLKKINDEKNNLSNLIKNAVASIEEAKKAKQLAVDNQKAAEDELAVKIAAIDGAKAKADEINKQIEELTKQAEELYKQLDGANEALTTAENEKAEADKKVSDAKTAKEEADKKEIETVSKEKDLKTQLSVKEKDAADIETKKKNVAEELGKVEEAAKQKLAEIIKNNSEELAKKKADIEAKKKAVVDDNKKKSDEADKKVADIAKTIEELTVELEKAKQEEVSAQDEIKNAENAKLDITKPVDNGTLPPAALYLNKYVGTKAFEGALVETFNAIATKKASSRNVVILGDHGFGLTYVGEDFARSFFDMGIIKNKTIAKIKAAALNKVKISDAMYKLKGGCLVIENAGLVANDKFVELVDLSAEDKNDVAIVLTGAKESIQRLLDNNKDIAGKFEYKIDVCKIANDDMLKIAKQYISQRGFGADSAVDGAIRNQLMAMESGNIDRMLKMVDDCILKCEQREKAKNIEGKKKLLAEDFK